MGEDEISRFAETSRNSSNSPVRLVSACRLIHWKAVDLTIDAVALAVSKDIAVELDVYEMGPEMGRLQKRVSELGLQKLVRFHGRVPRLEEVYEAISNAHALVHPAMHEAFGQVCLESLALGTPVICLNWAGPGEIVPKSCGYPVEVGSRDEVVSGIASAIQSCFEEPEEHEKKRGHTREQASKFSWCRVVEAIESSYL
jgi:glycosyltransferase involved in cell wall biosynthesis